MGKGEAIPDRRCIDLDRMPLVCTVRTHSDRRGARGERRRQSEVMMGLLSALKTEHRERLMALAHDVSFPSGGRIFEEGRKADRFWIIRTGAVTLDLHVPGRRAAVIETLGPGELIGW